MSGGVGSISCVSVVLGYDRISRGKMVILTETGRDIQSVSVCSWIVLNGIFVVRKCPCGVGTFMGKMVISTGVDWNGLGTVHNDAGGEETFIRGIFEG